MKLLNKNFNLPYQINSGHLKICHRRLISLKIYIFHFRDNFIIPCFQIQTENFQLKSYFFSTNFKQQTERKQLDESVIIII